MKKTIIDLLHSKGIVLESYVENGNVARIELSDGYLVEVGPKSLTLYRQITNICLWTKYSQEFFTEKSNLERATEFVDTVATFIKPSVCNIYDYSAE